MSKYKAGDKIVLEILPNCVEEVYSIGSEMNYWHLSSNKVDEIAEPLSEYTEKLEKKNENKHKRIEKLVERLHRQASEITRLLKENEDLKNSMEIIRDNAFEAGLIRGHEDAWKLAHKIFKMDVSTIEEIFIETGAWNLGSVLEDCTYSEAAAKVAEWERKKEEICVGDVVRFKSNNRAEFCVTDILDNSFLYGISAEGDVYADRDIKLFEKTGRHIDVASMLAQIGGEQEW